MKPFRLAAGLALAVLGSLGLGTLGLPAGPDLLLLPVADAARGGAAVLAMGTGFVAGLLEDLLVVPGRLLGLHAFTKVLAGYALATLGARIVVQKPLAVGGALATVVLLEAGARSGLLWVLTGDPLFPSSGLLLLRAGSTGLLGALLHALARFPWRERWEARRRMRLS